MDYQKLLVRPAEAAAMLSISRSSIYELISAGVVPSVRVGRMIRVSVASLQKLAAAEQPASDAPLTAAAQQPALQRRRRP